MAINHHFQGGNGIGNTNEKNLYEDLIIEGKQKFTAMMFTTYQEHLLIKT